jgi:tRNA(Arg) A34 adenosine deaminase TadA
MRGVFPRDEHFMRIALHEAGEAAAHGDVPVGCVVVRDGEVIGAAHNEREARGDPTAHAEILALRAAALQLGGWRLLGTVVYCTLEPCPMCAGAIHWARISRLVFSVSQAMLQERSGGRPKLACTEILHPPQIAIIGPALPEEGLAVFDGYIFTPKVARHSARFQE